MEPSATGLATQTQPQWLERGRALLLLIVALTCLGLGAELLLIGHYEGPYQWAPLALLVAGFGSSGLAAISPGRRSVRLLQAFMAFTLVSGFVGVALHSKGNLEFELEMTPTMRGLELAREIATGATPVLAPGAMTQLGLLGLLCTLRHPSLRKDDEPT